MLQLSAVTHLSSAWFSSQPECEFLKPIPTKQHLLFPPRAPTRPLTSTAVILLSVPECDYSRGLVSMESHSICPLVCFVALLCFYLTAPKFPDESDVAPTATRKQNQICDLPETMGGSHRHSPVLHSVVCLKPSISLLTSNYR